MNNLRISKQTVCCKTVCLFAFLLMILVFLSGCYTVSPNVLTSERNETESHNNEFAVDNQKASIENILITSIFQADPEHNGAYLCRGQTVWYYDFTANHATILCTQAGCPHKDNSCTAWQGSMECFGVYKGQWYPLVRNDDNSISLIRTGPQAKNREELFRLRPAANETFHVKWMTFSYGKVFVMIEADILDYSLDGESSASRNIFRLVALDLSGTQASFKDFNELSGVMNDVRFFGGTSDNLFLLYSYFEEPLLQFEDFIRNNPELKAEDISDAYIQYLLSYHRAIRRELRVYDLCTWNYHVLADQNLAEIELPCFDMDTLIYWTIDREKDDECRLYSVDMQTEETTELYADHGINNAELFNGKITVLCARDARIRYFWMDKVGGTPVEFTSLRDSDSIPFAIFQETDDYLIGTFHGSPAYIQKNDYYRGAFDRAVYFG